MAENKVSIRPSEFVEGGAVPVDKNLLWKECRFAKFEYTKKDGTVVATTTAMRVNYVDDDGTEYVQHYSAADPERFQPSEDGKRLVALGTSQVPTRSSNFYILMNALVNAGFPEDKLDDDISLLDGLYTHNVGAPEPKRSGLVRAEGADGAPARERIISVPSTVIRLPWEKKGAKPGAAAPAAKAAKAAAPAAASAAAPAAVPGAEIDLSAVAVKIINGLLENATSTTRQLVAGKAIREKMSPVAKYVFTEDFEVALLSGGFTRDGDTIIKAE